jgi:hypothetical protein
MCLGYVQTLCHFIQGILNKGFGYQCYEVLGTLPLSYSHICEVTLMFVFENSTNIY